MALSVSIVVEDDLSSAIVRRLILYTRRDWTVRLQLPEKLLPGGRDNPRNIEEVRGLSGFGQIKKRLSAFNHAAKAAPLLVLTDLDIHAPCPGGVWGAWMGGSARNPNLIFRVAVREVEAWLLADRRNMADFLAVPVADVTIAPESSADPKIEIVDLARRSSSQDVVELMVPLPGSSVEVGRSFEMKLRQFVKDSWDIAEAAKNSNSLTRAVAALQRFTFTPQP